MNMTDSEYHVLIIYDIIHDKRRAKLAEFLNGYGYRVQKSCFEAIITKKLYKQILKELPRFYNREEDSIRVYRLNGGCSITNLGLPCEVFCDRMEIL